MINKYFIQLVPFVAVPVVLALLLVVVILFRSIVSTPVVFVVNIESRKKPQRAN
jgi:hypothetical protein